MQYRKFGQMDVEVSALGFGTMRLPLAGDKSDPAQIDEQQAIAMIRHAIDAGVNYVDTAWFYHNNQSELLVAKALRDGYREKVFIATKSPLSLMTGEDDFEHFLSKQLERLETDCIDFYMLHCVTSDFWHDKVIPFGLIEKIARAKEEGRVKYIGFSFHDNYPLFKEVVDAYPWDFCQIQLNYLDVDNQATLAGMHYAADSGLGVIVMEPLLGGKLATPPKGVCEIFEAANPDRSPVEWALDFLWDKPEVSMLLSGMSDLQQTIDNVAYAKRSYAGMLTDAERETIAAVQAKFDAYAVIPCTACEYCMPCPQGVYIPGNFAAYNELHTYDSPEVGRKSYWNLPPFRGQTAQASHCTACKQCEAECPQHIAISELMPKIVEAFK